MWLQKYMDKKIILFTQKNVDIFSSSKFLFLTIHNSSLGHLSCYLTNLGLISSAVSLRNRLQADKQATYFLILLQIISEVLSILGPPPSLFIYI